MSKASKAPKRSAKSCQEGRKGSEEVNGQKGLKEESWRQRQKI